MSKRNTHARKWQNDDIWGHLEQLQKYIDVQEISSIRSMPEHQYYAMGGNTQPNLNSRKTQQPQDELVLVPKKMILKLLAEMKSLKKIIKSRDLRISDQLESLRKGVRQLNGQRLMLMRQKQYLSDMTRSYSQTKFYNTTPHFNK